MGKHSIIKFAVGASKVKYVALAVFTSLSVVSLLLYDNISFLDIFQKPDPYKEALVLFYGEGCEQCERVDDYLQANKVASKIMFERLEVFNNKENENALEDRARICGIERHQIGVPFLWEGPTRTCILGYLDVIDFFKKKVELAPKPAQ